MIGYSITMWFASCVVFMVAISLLRGNISGIHGKVFESTEDKVGYGKQLGKPCFMIGVGAFASGLVAFLTESNAAIVYALTVLLMVIAISVIWFVLMQKQYMK